MTHGPGYVRAFTSPTPAVQRERRVDLGSMAEQDADSVVIIGGSAIGVTLGGSSSDSLIVEAGAVPLGYNYVGLLAPESGSYAVTLAAPEVCCEVLMLELVGTAGTGTVTMALTNTIGASGNTTATWSDVGDVIVFKSTATKWLLTSYTGVTLS